MPPRRQHKRSPQHKKTNMIIGVKNSIGNQFLVNDKDELYLTEFRSVNVFIGINNSGKSQFLRQLFSSSNKNNEILLSDKAIFVLNEKNRTQFRNILNQVKRQMQLEIQEEFKDGHLIDKFT